MKMNVLLVDDDQESLDSLSSALRLEGYIVKDFATSAQALHAFNPQIIDVVITDFYLPGMTGIDLLKEIHRKKRDTPVIVISGAPRKKAIERISLKAGACAFFSKPLDIRRVITRIKQLIGIQITD
jgi:two-component system phosphoglycerate transport system response regulator PgtA